MTERAPERHPYTGHLIRRAQQAHAAVWARLASRETTSVQFTILVTLDELGEASQRELCDEADLDRSTIADLVKRMEARGLISRQRAADDARRNTVTLTEHGRTELEQLRPRVAEVEAELTSGLTVPEREQLRALLRAVLRDLPAGG